MLEIVLLFFLLMAIGVITVSRHARPSLSADNRSILAAVMFKGLFDDEKQQEFEQWQRQRRAAELRANLLERAKLGEVTTLDEAHADGKLYDEVLNALLDLRRQEIVKTCVRHISQSKELRANVRLARLMIDDFKAAPNKISLAQMLHIAALSDDAGIFDASLATALDFWERGSLRDLPAGQLLALCESEYWVLASEARRSGAGFALKDSLSRIRRKLAAAMRG